jgi:RNA polymerase sigma-70 factor (ECF subfamily)
VRSNEVCVDDLEDLLQRGFRYAVALCGDPATADDLLQDAWTGVLAAGGPRTKAYLFRAIKHRYIDRYRRAKVVPFEGLVDEPLAPPGADLAHRDTLIKALGVLRPEEREALYLCAVEGHTAAEAAELLEAPRNTVLSWVHRGRARIRDWLSASEEEVTA